MRAMGPAKLEEHEFQRLPVQMDAGGVQLEGTPDPCEERDHDDAPIEDRGDAVAFRPFDDVEGGGVDAHDGDELSLPGYSGWNLPVFSSMTTKPVDLTTAGFERHKPTCGDS